MTQFNTSPNPKGTFEMTIGNIPLGGRYIARDRREREGRTVSPVTVIDINPAEGTVRLQHPTRRTTVDLSRFREHYRPYTVTNGSN